MATASAGRADKGLSRGSGSSSGAPLQPRPLPRGRRAGQGRREAQGQTAELLRSNARSDHERPGNRRAARQGALRRRAGAYIAALDARPEGEHQAQPEVSPRKGRDPDRPHPAGGKEAGGIRPATPRAMRSASSSAWSRGSTSVMSESACANLAWDCRLAFRSPKGQGASKPRTDPSPNVGPIGRPCGRISPTWRYLARKRILPSAIIEAASAAGALRGGARPAALGSLISTARVPSPTSTFAGRPTKARSPAAAPSPSSACPPSAQSFPRLVLAEAAIDALSFAAIESLRADTLYAASGGGMGPGTIAALEETAHSHGDAPGRTLLQRHGRQWTEGQSLRRTPPIARGKIQRAVRTASASNRRRRLE